MRSLPRKVEYLSSSHFLQDGEVQIQKVRRNTFQKCYRLLQQYSSNIPELKKDILCNHSGEVKLNNYNALQTSDQLKSFSEILSCAQSGTRGSSLSIPTLMLVQTILLQAVNYCSFFQIQLSISHFNPQALSFLFRNCHWKSAGFHEPQWGRIPLDKKCLDLYFSN